MDRLGISGRKLLPAEFDLRIVLERYRVMVQEAFKNPGRLKPLDIDRILNDPIFRQWEDAKSSSIMLLHGNTALTKTDYSWLSPATFHLIDRYSQQQIPAFFHLCHDKIFMESDTPLHVIVSSLIYQVLRSRPSVLQSVPLYQDMSSTFSDPAWRTASFRKFLDILIKRWIRGPKYTCSWTEWIESRGAETAS